MRIRHSWIAPPQTFAAMALGSSWFLGSLCPNTSFNKIEMPEIKFKIDCAPLAFALPMSTGESASDSTKSAAMAIFLTRRQTPSARRAGEPHQVVGVPNAASCRVFLMTILVPETYVKIRARTLPMPSAGP
ncbi:MAG: hypothetical protein ACHQRJ_01810 [Alphaproteobacteria bacterium]